MSAPWWVQTIFSALWDQNQNRIKTKIPQIPKKQQEGMQEVLHTDPSGGTNVALVSNAHPTVSPAVSPAYPLPMARHPGNGQAASPPSPPPHDSPAPRLLLREESLLPPGRRAVHDVGKVGEDFQNTDSLPRSLAVCGPLKRRSPRQPGGAMHLKRKGKEKQKQNHPKSVFSQTEGETGGWYGLLWGRRLGDDGR